MLPETIRTARLVLRPPRLEDVQVIFDRYAQDAEVTRYLTFRPHRKPSETEAFIRGCTQAWAGDTRRPWVLTRVDAGGGAVGMLDLRQHRYRANVGYVLARAEWGQGLMTEALQAVADLVLAQDRSSAQPLTACVCSHAQFPGFPADPSASERRQASTELCTWSASFI